MADAEQRVAALGKDASESARLAKLFGLPESVFPEGVDVYTALAAHVLGIPPKCVTKPQRNEVKSRIVEWLYYGKTIR